MRKSPTYLGATILMLALTAYQLAEGQTSKPAVSGFRVTLLGTSTPNPLPDRFGPSTFVEAGDEKLLFDCGRGSTIRLWQLKIPVATVQLFLTYLHSDHTVGIPDLWLTGFGRMPYARRTAAFSVWGPKGTAGMTSFIEKAYKEDIRIRREFVPELSAQQTAIIAKH